MKVNLTSKIGFHSSESSKKLKDYCEQYHIYENNIFRNEYGNKRIQSVEAQCMIEALLNEVYSFLEYDCFVNVDDFGQYGHLTINLGEDLHWLSSICRFMGSPSGLSIGSNNEHYVEWCF